MAEKKIKKYALEEAADDEVSLIGLNTPMEIYRIGFFINKVLKIKLQREDMDFIYRNKRFVFPLYHNYCIEKQLDFHLVPNQIKVQNENSGFGGLFQENLYNEVAYLIPEKKEIDYLLKIEGCLAADEFLEKIRNNSMRINVYPIDFHSLKSKKNLIFHR